MTDKSGQALDLDLPDELQPPMANGEVLFEEPWQGRVFAMAVGLHEAGAFAWSEFQNTLIEVVGEWDQSDLTDQPYLYYEHFQTALGRLLDCKGIVSTAALNNLTNELAARPHGHDH